MAQIHNNPYARMGTGAAFLFVALAGVQTFICDSGLVVATLLLAPVLASFIAAGAGPRPATQGIAACLLGLLPLLAINASLGTSQGGRDLLPPLCFIAYYILVGGAVGMLSPARRRREDREEHA